MDAKTCNSKGCCWHESNVQGEPWCFRKNGEGPNLEKPTCEVNNLNKVNCGYMGITKASCEHLLCCYEETAISNVPWCFHQGEGGSEPTSTTTSSSTPTSYAPTTTSTTTLPSNRVAKPVFSPPFGKFESQVLIQISSETDGAEIYYSFGNIVKGAKTHLYSPSTGIEVHTLGTTGVGFPGITGCSLHTAPHA